MNIDSVMSLSFHLFMFVFRIHTLSQSILWFLSHACAAIDEFFSRFL
uniref:Uncharacterized protein n=1 Tax=Trichobilharzia regenti TaxID=157069 RepID=A0AA85JMX1_TRIRE|nr:unnamed protein product [Trichobilharzia regenti]